MSTLSTVVMPAFERVEKERLAAVIMERVRREVKRTRDFAYFIDNVFSQSFLAWTDGEYLDEVAENFDANPYTIDVGPRDHFKSTRLYARIMFLLMVDEDVGGEGWYFSYNTDLSRYHLEKVKELIRVNPYYSNIIDVKKQSESSLSYRWPSENKRRPKPKFTFTPSSLLTFKRGIHADYIFIDDPLKDPENKLAPTIIHKINRIIKVEVLAMVNKGGECRVVGTPQTYQDFFYDEAIKNEFVVTFKKAIVDEIKRIALWPAWKSFEWLINRRNTIGDKEFEQEYQMIPAYASNSFLDRIMLKGDPEKPDDYGCINPELENLTLGGEYPELAGMLVTAGHDIGKKSHPAHFSVFKWPTVDGVRRPVQIHTHWFDGVDYGDQLDYLKVANDCFNITVLRYDNTRGEFEGFVEQGIVPKNFEPVVFGSRNQYGYAASLEKHVNNQTIELIDDGRQIDQMLAVNNDLDAMQSPEGHGDSFWSNGLAVSEKQQPKPNIRSVS